MFNKNIISKDERSEEYSSVKSRTPLIFISCFIILLLVLNFIIAIISPVINAGPENEKNSTDSEKLALEVVGLDSEINNLNERIAGLRSDSKSLQVEISATEGRIESNRSELANRKNRLNARAREIYINGRSDTLVTFLTSDDFSDFMKKHDYIDMVATNDSKLIKEVKRKSEELDGLLAGLKNKEADSKSLLNDLEARKDDLEKSKKDRETTLAGAGPKKDEVEQKSKQAESRMDEINQPDNTPPPAGKEITMIATAYSPEEPGLSDSTATGLKAQKGVVAVDPSFIPLGTRVYVEGYGYAIAADTGSAIKGNRIDLCYDTLEEALAFGRRTVKVKILN